MTMRRTVALLLALVAALPAAAQDDRTLLAPTYPLEALDALIVPRGEWHPYPTASNPAGLDDIPEPTRAATIELAEEIAGRAWERLPATLFLEYVRTGNRSNYEAVLFERRDRLATLVLAELFEREGRFIDPIVNGVWAIAEESFWGVPAHLGAQEAGPGLPDVAEPTVDLFAAEAGALLAWTHYLLGDQLDAVDPLVTDRIERELDRRILTPYLETDDYWWMGFTWREGEQESPVNNWNPWINSNVLAAALLVEDDPERRLRIIHKIMDSVDAFIEPYPSDGGSDEGPGYWGRAGASLFDVLDLLHDASAGRIDLFDEPLIQEMGRFIYRTYIDHPYFINFADAEAKTTPDPALVYRYGKAIDDAAMMHFAAFMAERRGLDAASMARHLRNLPRALPALSIVDELLATEPRAPLVRDVWLPDVQVMAARSQAGSADGFYVAAKGGHNDESHNHNDVGNFVVFHDGLPVLVDAGRQTYTARTFSAQRYELWNNQSAYHNVPSINGVMQHEGRAFAASGVRHEADDETAALRLDVAGAYPDEGGAASWVRTVTLHRGESVAVVDEYRLASFRAPSTLHFLTPLDVDTSAPGRVVLSGNDGRRYALSYDAERLLPAVDTVTLDDPILQRMWGEALRRIDLVSQTEDLEGRFEVRVTTE